VLQVFIPVTLAVLSNPICPPIRVVFPMNPVNQVRVTRLSSYVYNSCSIP
jgi:hypothetical protein